MYGIICIYIYLYTPTSSVHALRIVCHVCDSDNELGHDDDVTRAIYTSNLHARNAAVESAFAVASKLIARGCPSQLAAYMQGLHLMYAI